jgi:anti-sigma B factor antagonist
MPNEPLTYALRPGGRDGVEIMSLAGPFTLNNIFQFQRDLHDMQPPFMIFDFAQVPYMDSAGLGLLMNFYVSAQKNGRRMAVAGATPRVSTLFEMTRVDGLLRLFSTVEQAEAAG